MSLILDALKRADAERERGAIPGLHAKQLASYEDSRSQVSIVWIALIVAISVALLAGGGFWWWRTTTPVVVASAAKPLSKAVTPQAVLPVLASPAEPVSSRPTPSATPSVISAPNKTPTNPQREPDRPTPPASKAVAKVIPVVPPKPVPPVAPKPAPAPIPMPGPINTPQPPVPSNPVAAANATKPISPPATGGIPLFGELPETVRSQIPPLTISGAVYSEDPSQRVLLLNNQAFGQGNSVAPGVKLEEIQPNSSIFNFQGTRFQLSH